MEIFRLFGSIFINDKGALNSLNAIDKKGMSVGQSLAKMGTIAIKAGALIATGAVAAGGAIFALAKKSSDAASEIYDMSKRTGLSAERLQELKFAAEQSGVEFESIAMATKLLTDRMSDVANGSKTATKVFEKLGITVLDNNGQLRKMEDIFPEVIRSLSKMENETERNAIASDLFGRSAAELIPLMSQGEEGMDALSKKAHELGLVLSDESVKAGEEFGDKLDALKASFGAITTKIGLAFMPMLTKLADWISTHMPEIQAFFQKAFEVAGSIAEKVWTVFETKLMPVLVEFWEWVQPNLPMIGEMFGKAFEIITEVIGGAVDVIKAFS